jgi:formylglycine-generating enzyme required for sulfatase activity
MNRKSTSILAAVVGLLLTSCITEHNFNKYLVPEPDGIDAGGKDNGGETTGGDIGLDTPDVGPDIADVQELYEVHDAVDIELDMGDEECVPVCDGEEMCEDNGCGGMCEANCGDDNLCNGKEFCEEFECKTGDLVICDDGFSCNGLETCNSEDGKCLAGDPVACNDENPCTTDSCYPLAEAPEAETGCVFTPLDDGPAPEGECNDANPCTYDNCLAGDCNYPVKPLEELGEDIDLCVCTVDDDCLPLDDQAFCNGQLYCETPPDQPEADFKLCQVNPETVPDCADQEGLFCNGEEICAECLDCDGGDYECLPGEAIVVDDAITCTIDTCDEENNIVVNTPTDAECDDDNVCSADTCNPTSGCVYAAAVPPDGEEDIECTPEDLCEVNGLCDDMICIGENLADLTPAEHEDGCNDSNVCTEDTCMAVDAAAKCFWAPDADVTACEDGNFCTLDDACADMFCVSGGPKNCNDSDACTLDGCNQDSGDCTHTPLDIDDADPCTDDACDQANGEITHIPVVYDDGLFCNGLETCEPVTGLKVDGIAPAVDDLVGCTVDLCDEENDIVTHTPDNGLCVDEFYCNGIETCDAVMDCLDGDAVVCSDEEVCTDDWCDEETDGCKFANNIADCDDVNACTEDDVCADGICAGTDKDCSDEVECTINETCDAQGQCIHDLDHDFCDDGNNCTDDVCDPDDGCLNTPVENGGACVLADPCYTNPSCTAGVCTGAFDIFTCGDFDHDGLFGDDDLCPYAFDPGNPDGNGIAGTDACEDLADHGDFQYQRKLALSQEGGESTWRRTHEPVEIPLANGIIDDSVVGYWKFDDGQAVDYSGNGNHGVVNGAVAGGGKFGDEEGALVFDGEDDYVDTSYIPEFGPGDALTLSIWARGTVLETTTLVGAEQKSAAHFNLFLVPGDCGFEFRDTDMNGVLLYAEAPANPEMYHHYVAVRSPVDDKVLLYLDGVLAASTEDLTGTIVAPELAISIGVKNKSSGLEQYFPGSIDEVIIFNRALSPDEIETYYRSSAPYGTKFVPGAQSDFDDVRVTEVGDDGTEFVKRSRVLGPRPHSDTPCPMDQDDGTWADRDDLCGVEAYWRLDGDAADVMGEADGVNNGAVPASGRFGDGGGALEFIGESYMDTGLSPALVSSSDFTVESWARCEDDGGTILGFEHNNPYGAMKLDFKPNTDVGVFFALHDDDFNNNTILTDKSANHCDGGWHHLAASYSADSKTATLYVDGMRSASSQAAFNGTFNKTGLSIYIGALNKEDGTAYANTFFSGAIDEVIIHNVAKSPDYIYHRANPGVPKLRFLGNTQIQNAGSAQAPSYPLRDYKLYWGDQTAQVIAPLVKSLDEQKTCYGLLSECIGYAGWWRFNEGSGDVVVDSSGNKNDGVVQDVVGRGPGLEGIGIVLSGTSDSVTVPHSPDFDLQTFTVEMAAQPDDVATEGDYLLAKTATGPHDNYAMLLREGNFRLQFEYLVNGGGIGDAILTGGQPQSGEWTWVSGQFDGASMSLFHENEPVGSHAPPAGPFTDGEIPLTMGHHYSGLLDEIRIMNRALATDEFLHFPFLNWQLETGNWQLDCAGIICPELAGYTVSCNTKDHCEYANEEPAGWKQWDVWVWVAPGSFMMGSEGEAGGTSDEMPVHSVTIDSGYYISKYEIVVEQYEACNAADPVKCTASSTADWPGYGWGTNSSANNRSDHPQNGLTWQQSKDFCGWVAPGGRLPSEAEWEYAATGPIHMTYPWGNTPDPTCQNDTAVFKEDMGGNNDKYGCEIGGTWKAGAKSAGMSWCGALDVSGSLFEWTEDWYHNSYVNAPNDGTAWVDPTGSGSHRGGSFSEGTERMRSAYRGHDAPGLRSARIGARCVRPGP